MNVKRISGVDIRRNPRQPISTEDRLHQLVKWVNVNIVNFPELKKQTHRHDAKFKIIDNHIVSIEMNLDALEQYVEENLE